MTTNTSFASLSDLDATKEEMIAIRRHLHAHPELSHQEEGTARFVADKLKSWGYEVTEGIGGHGIVARMKVGTGKRSIAIRADMDALPIHEETGLDYASSNPGVMHACGHDGHTTMLLAAAEYLARTKRFSGTLNLIFQPAEEAGTTSGAQKMIADGLFERFPFDAIFGLHNNPGTKEGTVLVRSGPLMAASDTATITIHGKGGHGSRPHLAVDPVYVACSLVVALQSIVSRSVDPTKTAVITVGTIHAGQVVNVISSTAKMELTIRTFEEDVRQQVEDRIRALSNSIAEGNGATAEIVYERGHPVVTNTEEETAFAREVAEELVGKDNVELCPLVPGSEDFAHYQEHKPGCFLRLGNGVDSASLHNPRYNFADAALTTGAALWARLTERYLHD